jgi:hypothetical protein
MAQRCGTKAEHDAARPPARLFEALGFVMLAGFGLAILAGVVLLPPYARLLRARYERDRLAAQVHDEQAALAAYRRLIAHGRDDPILVQRLAMDTLGLVPTHEVVFRPADATRTIPPGVVRVDRAPRPTRPAGWAVRAAQRLSNPAIRRGLMLLSGLTVLVAVVLFVIPDR